jgi:simple sugar transport system substrate-binding protein
MPEPNRHRDAPLANSRSLQTQGSSAPNRQEEMKMFSMTRRNFLLSSAAGASIGFGPKAFAEDAVLKVGVVHQGPIAELGWEAFHARAWRGLEAKFGGKVKVTVLDNVQQAQDAERVFRQLASQGNQLVIGTTFSQYATLRKLAPTLPKTTFECCAGIATLPNLGVFEARSYEGTYLTGIAAGKMTKSNILGWVGAFPVPQVIYNVNAFLLGARSVNPQAVCKLVWANAWSDPAKEKDAVDALVSQGADVLSGSPNTPVLGLAAEEKGVWSIGSTGDFSDFVKNKQLTSFELDWMSAYIEAAQGVMDRNWKAESWWRGLGPNGFVRMTSQNLALPADVRGLMAEKEQAIIDRKFHPFTGEIKDQSGKVRVAAGATLPDPALRGIDWLAEGIQGQLPRS